MRKIVPLRAPAASLAAWKSFTAAVDYFFMMVPYFYFLYNVYLTSIVDSPVKLKTKHTTPQRQ